MIGKPTRWAAGAAGWSLLLMSQIFAGCVGGTICDDAVSKLTGECGLGSGATLGGGLRTCEDEVECRAECVLETDCDEIVSDEPDNDLNECFADCAAEAMP